ncbi:hypothetical protein C7K25_12090 [Gulosibacter molinativorax]|uniref:Potassium-transporting ATPase subunit F n=2 Tax=Gulosibacter molinativorax TaxID=256821 RepID=A0ABT7CAB3_9MICO|nr:hypothetical protein [Gulosibacter molinativorax]
MRPAARFVFIAIIVVIVVAAVSALASLAAAGTPRAVLQYIALGATAIAYLLGILFAFVGESRF